MSSLLELHDSLKSDGFPIDDHFIFSGRHYLSVQFVNINIVENAYFVDYPDLFSLQLYFCGIRAMRLNAFGGQRRLRQLQLVGVDLREFDLTVLRHIPSLRQLKITGSSFLKSIGCSDASLILADLREMDLSSNGLTLIEHGLFDHVPDLHVLNLANNELEWLPNGAFANSTALHTIDLSGNMLKSLQSDLFSNVKPLATILLRRNPLKCHMATIQAIMDAIRMPRQVLIDWIVNEFPITTQILAAACEAHQEYMKQLAEEMIIVRSVVSKTSGTFHQCRASSSRTAGIAMLLWILMAQWEKTM